MKRLNDKKIHKKDTIPTSKKNSSKKKNQKKKNYLNYFKKEQKPILIQRDLPTDNIKVITTMNLLDKNIKLDEFGEEYSPSSLSGVVGKPYRAEELMNKKLSLPNIFNESKNADHITKIQIAHTIIDDPISKPEQKILDNTVPYISEILKTKEPSKVSNDNMTKIQNLRYLSLIQILQIFAWPVLTLAKIIYWPVKLKGLENGKKYYHEKYNDTKSEDDKIIDIFAPPTKKVIIPFEVHKDWSKILITFIIICVIFIFPIQIAVYYEHVSGVKSGIVKNSLQAIDFLKESRIPLENFNFFQASERFFQAKEHFIAAQDEFDRLNIITKNLILALPKEKKVIQTTLSLLSVGEGIAEAGFQISDILKTYSQADIMNSQWKENFLITLSQIQLKIDTILPQLVLAQKALTEVDFQEFTPAERDAFEQVAKKLPVIKEFLHGSSIILRNILMIAGHPQWQRYLVLLQNNNELRATGGFIGSFAIVDIEDGNIKNITIPQGGSYDLQGSLQVNIASPQPLQVINPRWEFQDANWWPDFPTSAQKINWFFENAKGPSLDGIIAVTSTMIERILEITGPVEMYKYGRVIDAQNFIEETQKIVELEYDKVENKPKKFLAELAPKLFEKMNDLNSDQLNDIMYIIYQGLKEKQILLYSFDPAVQDMILSLNWGGKIEQNLPSSDYLSVIHTNIGGQKTDGVITEKIIQQTTITPMNQIYNTVTIARKHNGMKGEQFFGVQNNSYIRVYVPAGSKLLSAEGFDFLDKAFFEEVPIGLKEDEDLYTIEGQHFFDSVSGIEIYKEFDKTVFAGWMLLKPGEEKSVILEYQIPYSMEILGYYSTQIQKQAGSAGSEYQLTLNYDDSYTISKLYPDTRQKVALLKNQIDYRDILTTDKFFITVFEKWKN